VTGIVSFVYFFITGYSYYFTSTENRFFHPLHESLKPSGIVGHGIGIIGSIMIIAGVVLYMIRKRVQKFKRFGILKYWLEFHIFLCSVGPILVLFHTAFKFGGIVAVSFWSMVAVVLSGIIGRYIYIQIPRSIKGHEYSVNELIQINDEYSRKLHSQYNLRDEILYRIDHFKSKKSYKNLAFLDLVKASLKDYFADRKLIGELKSAMKVDNIEKKNISEVIHLCRSKLILTRRIGMLRTAQKLFKYWHIIHLPFALIMIIIMIIHIGVAVAFGYRWIF
jgi:hypothetical protein